MVKLYDGGVYLVNGREIVTDPAALPGKCGRNVTKEEAEQGTIAYGILKAHNKSGDMQNLRMRFDSLTSHDITYVGIIQTARASGMKEFPMPYVLTNCHNSLCAVGGTINEDDHMFALSAAHKYGGIYVPTNMAVIISSITGKLVSPVTLARKSEEWGCFVSGAGTAFAFFPKAAAAYGINCYQFNYSKQTVLNYLKQGKMIICTMGKGHFTNGSHFVTLRGITDDGNILIADTYSESNTYKEWTLDYLASQLKHGMMWAFYK